MEVVSAASTGADARVDPLFKCTDYAEGMGNLVQRMVVQPVMKLLRRGASPEQLAWSIAVGIVVGVNPLLGSTTLVVLALAGLFRLNVVASQVGNHAMYLPELALFPVFVKVGSVVFSTQKLPLEDASVEHDAAAVGLGVACAGGVGGVRGGGAAGDCDGTEASAEKSIEPGEAAAGGRFLGS
jgi:hypothetical protein